MAIGFREKYPNDLVQIRQSDNVLTVQANGTLG